MLIARSTEIHYLPSINHCKVSQGELFFTVDDHYCSVNSIFQKDNYFGLGFIAK